jgi:hypothetical protein
MILKSLKEFSGEIVSVKPKACDRIDLAAEYFKGQGGLALDDILN